MDIKKRMFSAILCGCMLGTAFVTDASGTGYMPTVSSTTNIQRSLPAQPHGKIEFASVKIEKTGLSVVPGSYHEVIYQVKDLLADYGLVEHTQLRDYVKGVYDEKLEILIETLCDFCSYPNEEHLIDDSVFYIIENLKELSPEMIHDIDLAYIMNLQQADRDGTLHEDGTAHPHYLFTQTDPEWASLNYPCYDGQHHTMAGSACGPSAMSLILSEYFHHEILPTEVSDFSYERGHRYTTGTATSLFTDAAIEYGLPAAPVNCGSEVLDELYQAIRDNGHMAIALMGPGVFTGGGHYVTLVGAKEIDGKEYFLVADPNYPNKHYKMSRMIDEDPSDSFIYAEKSIFREQMREVTWFQFDFNEITDTFQSRNNEVLLEGLSDKEFLPNIPVGVSQEVKEDTLYQITKNKQNDQYMITSIAKPEEAFIYQVKAAQSKSTQF